MELRERIARIISEGDFHDTASALIADEILALPEIAEAQGRIVELERELGFNAKRNAELAKAAGKPIGVIEVSARTAAQCLKQP